MEGAWHALWGSSSVFGLMGSGSVSQPFATFCYLQSPNLLLSFSTCLYRWPPLAAFFCPLIPLVRNILTLMRIRAPGKTPANPEGESESLYRGSKADWDHRATQTCSPCRGYSPIRNRATLAPYSSFMSRALWWSWGGGVVSYERGTPVGTAQLTTSVKFRT